MAGIKFYVLDRPNPISGLVNGPLLKKDFQLSRAVETRGGTKRPMLSDLRESGAIEQDADIVSFIYRPEYYGMDEWDDDDRSSAEGQAEFIVSKHRNGALDSIRLKFISSLGKFEDLNNFNDSSLKYNSSINDGKKNLDNNQDSIQNEKEIPPF